MTTVFIDGVLYVPAEPDEVRFYYMHDNHTFTRLLGNTLEEILIHADAVEAVSSFGMLCDAVLMRQGKEFARVGTVVHSGSSKDSKDAWNSGKEVWLRILKENKDVMRILSKSQA